MNKLKNKKSTNKLVISLMTASVLLPIATPLSVLADDSVKIVDTKVEITGSTNTSKDTASQIAALENEITKTKEENEKLKTEAEELEVKIKELNDQVTKFNKALKEQAKSVQLNKGSGSFIQTLVETGSLTEALQMSVASNKVADANIKTIDDYNKTIKEIEAKQKDVYNKQDTLANNLILLETKQIELEKLKAQQEMEEAQRLSDSVRFSNASNLYNNLTNQYNTALTVQAGSSDIQPNYSANTGSYPVGQCTWGAKALAPWAGNYWGNAAQWGASAAAAGFRTGSVPEVGAIISWNDGGLGHVAVVYAVESPTSIRVKECNYAGNTAIQDYRGWFNPLYSGAVTYIYPN